MRGYIVYYYNSCFVKFFNRYEDVLNDKVIDTKAKLVFRMDSLRHFMHNCDREEIFDFNHDLKLKGETDINKYASVKNLLNELEADAILE